MNSFASFKCPSTIRRKGIAAISRGAGPCSLGSCLYLSLLGCSYQLAIQYHNSSARQHASFISPDNAFTIARRAWRAPCQLVAVSKSRLVESESSARYDEIRVIANTVHSVLILNRNSRDFSQNIDKPIVVPFVGRMACRRLKPRIPYVKPAGGTCHNRRESFIKSKFKQFFPVSKLVKQIRKRPGRIYGSVLAFEKIFLQLALKVHRNSRTPRV